MSVEQEQGLIRAPRVGRELEPRRIRRRRSRGLLEAPRKNRRQRRVRKLLVVLVVLGALLALTVPIALWAQYQRAFVVSNNASVKGSITHVGAQLHGVVKSVEVEAGQRAKAGQILARFEDHQLRTSILRAQSRRAETAARVASARARIAAAKSQTAEARMLYEQNIRLAKMGAVSQNELRAADTKLQTALANEMTAFADFQATEAEVGAAGAEITLAKADLEATLIRAPADGYVLRRVAEPGASVVVGQPVVDLWIGNEVWVEAWVREEELPYISVGNEAKVTIKSRGNRPMSGVVQSIGVTTDFVIPDEVIPQPRDERMRTTPVVCARIKLNETEGLFPGLSAVVGIKKNAPLGIKKIAAKTAAKNDTK